jgi:ADP-ribose pyrophosphatase
MAWNMAIRSLHSASVRLLRGVTLGVRGLVTGPEGVLLVRHGYRPGWYLPGGAVDPGESAEEAVRREVLEETGIAFLAAPRLVGLYFNAGMANRDHVALFVVEEGQWRRERPFVPGAEIREARFFPAHALPAEATDATRRRVGEALAGGQPVSGRW